jgi:glycosyltransferase involved in cell wall biosynthesis
VTVEALAMGLTVVSSRFNGGKEVLSETSGAIIEDLLDPDSVATALQWALERPKNNALALQIRDSVSHLDFSRQIQTMLDLTIS